MSMARMGSMVRTMGASKCMKITQGTQGHMQKYKKAIEGHLSAGKADWGIFTRNAGNPLRGICRNTRNTGKPLKGICRNTRKTTQGMNVRKTTQGHLQKYRKASQGHLSAGKTHRGIFTEMQENHSGASTEKTRNAVKPLKGIWKKYQKNHSRHEYKENHLKGIYNEQLHPRVFHRQRTGSGSRRM